MIAIVAVVSAAVADENSTLSGVHDRFVNGMYVVDGAVHFSLTEDMREALNNGIVLTYDVEVEIYAPRRWIWDDLLVRSVQRRSLEYHALTRSYIVNNSTTRAKRSVHTLEEALEVLGEVKDMAISEQRHLPQPGPYEARMRASLDVESLPAPLRPVAYLSPDWHLDSDWQHWTVAP